MSIVKIIEQRLREERDAIRKRREQFRASRDKLEPLLTELHELGCELRFPNSIDVTLTGDKHKFLALLRVLNRHGLKTPKIEKGATGLSHFFYPEGTELSLYVVFSSTVCRRVKVGTKMVEQEIYETVCDEIYPHGEQPVPAPAPTSLNEIPF